MITASPAHEASRPPRARRRGFSGAAARGFRERHITVRLDGRALLMAVTGHERCAVHDEEHNAFGMMSFFEVCYPPVQ